MPSRRLATFALICFTFACMVSQISTSAPSPAAGRKQAPAIRCEPAVAVADEEFAWHLSLTLTNPSAAPLIADSGRVVVEDLDQGETRAPRTNKLPLSRLVQAVGTL